MQIVEDPRMAEQPHQLPGQFGEQQAQGRENEKRDHEGERFAGALQPAAQPAEHGGAEQRQPQHVQRCFR